ncbi:hypothetical protein ETD86_29575 [Nonomuraea turkmeniaca]|uniref:Uncharacterized protein n=1 Tax=Nonomuraea turkmeniaca TaxID=103838 RepID=A0A5S4FA37_9ACTN|nr:hypothetical protein [Nonomuraea turkmeniaca]TMR14098.1 hypothetical protein ETD86_29575 [Nonomuraea turkmeniaca]
MTGMTQEPEQKPAGHGSDCGHLSVNVDQLVNDMIGGQPAHRQAYLQDARTHYEAKLLAKTLRAVDRAMMAEGIGRPVRERIIARALYGGPLTPQEAEARMREQAGWLESREEALRQLRLPAGA